MEDHSNLSKMNYYEFKLHEAKSLYNEGVVEEDEHQVIIDASKLQKCHSICMTLIEVRPNIPLNVQAHAFYYLSTGRSDDVALAYLKNAVSCCETFEAQTGEAVNGREIFNEALQEMLIAMGAEQSEYGGITVGSTKKGRSEGLLKARGLPTLTITAPSPSASGSRRKLPTVRTKQAKQESQSDEENKIGVVLV